MNDNAPSSGPTPGLFIPFIILAASVLVFLVWQISNVQSQRTSLAKAKAEVAEAIQKREPQVAQAIEMKTRFEALGMDLLELSKTDEKAMAIVKKYNIQRALPPTDAGAGK